MEQEKLRRRKRPLTFFAILILLVLTTAGITASLVFYNKYRDTQNSEQVAQSQILERIAKAVQLPNGRPTVITVEDKDKLTNKVLAKRVQNKDMLLFYPSARRLIVYRPATSKVIDMLDTSAPGNATLPKQQTTTKP